MEQQTQMSGTGLGSWIQKYKSWSFRKRVTVTTIAVTIFIGIIGAATDDSKNISPVQNQPVNTVSQPTATPTASPTMSKEAAQKELNEVMDLAKRAGLVISYEFSDRASVVYAGATWYTQTVAFKKDFMAKIATLKKAITGYQHFEVKDAYSDEKVGEVTSFLGDIKVYK
ncbi:MAG: hypothetical protein A3B91_03670 [Candidatus Yanofskybacteria bacterium RIFCSPHIGHO2_02_FULL_41_29]|uniref:Uncharacterized protein n=1 Tax=Candidatus Yanofskybacteria bacterium RIFCSPHIGHO2_01_FULL_41_53 TaxID=1802663 RepID=A0A1F8EKK1_9BACT|nr:MAG: hypothetical protein A2650_00675 [Candidatus Yanofskybacteria bacterium RIFCSPHIGHO2_01_FULL_41_53]OGN10856.1 MAG: hypothetical protein A3B91_03670 [Candidatus Yanofskybacteria bacterium RIFCSPHIGHO2_02_FULL_41_29]OGN24481.1 MAG: hypothetical protein A2916_02510 [Candidatus Yanofskybacteria bacterium RIFCSPLOWO2_01_FULL_41_67]OGN29525.1 MAG: hypothetical protein A3H54_01310 [Candidatus Yanofskybacteria bacterium RIFCSPLOWO2_02_FULL_41_13]OGN34090.1 MAG: hypothetical protein A3F98_01360 